MSEYNEQIRDLFVQYEVLVNELKEIYPAYKSNPTNSEIQKIYENILSQIQSIFSQLETISMKVGKSNEEDQIVMNVLNTNIKNSKSYYNTSKSKLDKIIDSNKSALPREEQIYQELKDKYYDFAYLLVLLGITIYSLRKLLY